MYDFRWKGYTVRFVLSILMIGGFIFILYLGPLALVLLVSTSSAILYLVLGCPLIYPSVVCTVHVSYFLLHMVQASKRMSF